MDKIFKKGAFTLIELLIVIALLGALAVGLLAALDPFEQLKKGTDTGIRNTVSEIHGAVIRYYAIKSEMPWGTTGYSGPASGASSYLQTIIDTGELKADFFKLAGNQLEQIYINGGSETVVVCFQPKSRSFRSDPNTKFTQDGQTDDNCPNPTANTCYWCVR